jgi:hypothetical protein
LRSGFEIQRTFGKSSYGGDSASRSRSTTLCSADFAIGELPGLDDCRLALWCALKCRERPGHQSDQLRESLEALLKHNNGHVVSGEVLLMAHAARGLRRRGVPGEPLRWREAIDDRHGTFAKFPIERDQLRTVAQCRRGVDRVGSAEKHLAGQRGRFGRRLEVERGERQPGRFEHPPTGVSSEPRIVCPPCDRRHYLDHREEGLADRQARLEDDTQQVSGLAARGLIGSVGSDPHRRIDGQQSASLGKEDLARCPRIDGCLGDFIAHLVPAREPSRCSVGLRPAIVGRRRQPVLVQLDRHVANRPAVQCRSGFDLPIAMVRDIYGGFHVSCIAVSRSSVKPPPIVRARKAVAAREAMYTPHRCCIIHRVKRIQIYIEEAIYEQLTRHARRERRSMAALIRDAVHRQYADEQGERFDDWAGGIDEEPGDVDDVVYGR